MANIAARLNVAGTVHLVNVKDMPARGDFAARTNVNVIVLTDDGGFCEVSFPEEAHYVARTLARGERVSWPVDLSDGKGDRGAWFRLSYAGPTGADAFAASAYATAESAASLS